MWLHIFTAARLLVPFTLKATHLQSKQNAGHMCLHSVFCFCCSRHSPSSCNSSPWIKSFLFQGLEMLQKADPVICPERTPAASLLQLQLSRSQMVRPTNFTQPNSVYVLPFPDATAVEGEVTMMQDICNTHWTKATHKDFLCFSQSVSLPHTHPFPQIRNLTSSCQSASYIPTEDALSG